MNVTIPAWALCTEPLTYNLLTCNFAFLESVFQRRTRVDLSRRDHRVTHHVTDRVSLFQQATDLP